MNKTYIVRELNRTVIKKDLKKGQFAIARVGAFTESPDSPRIDEVRLYYRDKKGKLIVFLGREVK